MTRAEAKRLHRAKAIAKGRCSVCCARSVTPGFRTCATCRIRSRGRHADIRAGYELAKAAGLLDGRESVPA